MDNKELIVIGGGITGLATAYLASKNGASVTVIEKSDKIGGLLQTFEIGGNRLEFFYHHFFTHDVELQWLFKELGIQDKVVSYKTTMGAYINNKTYALNSPFDLFKIKPIQFFDKLKFLFSGLFLAKFANWRKYEGVAANDWLKTFAGSTSASALWTPLLKVKFGPFFNVVPLAWMVGRLKQRATSRKKGEEQLTYLQGSLNELLKALIATLEKNNVKILKSTAVEALILEGKTLKGIKLSDGNTLKGKVVFTTPTPVLHDLLPDCNLKQTLKNINYFGAVCTVLEMEKPLSDIYWLNIADESFPFGGIIEHTNFIPKSNYNNLHIAYLSRYFAHTEEIAKMDSKEIEELMLKHLFRLHPEYKKEWIKKIHIFRTNTAATVCDLNYSKKIPNCKTEFEDLYIASMCHVYPDERSTNNSIRVATEACRVMGFTGYAPPKGNGLSGQIGFKI